MQTGDILTSAEAAAFEVMREALETIAAGNTDPDRMVELAQEALKEVQ